MSRMSSQCRVVFSNSNFSFQAGIGKDQLTIALEPEAASIYCHALRLEVDKKENKMLQTIKSGMKFMVIDLGGRFFFT